MDEQTTEQRNNAIRDAQTIDSSVLSPSAPEIRPVEPIVPDVPILQATEPEKEVSAAQKRIAELNTQTVGESARRTTLEGEADIEGKTEAIQSFQNELKLIQAEQSALAEQQRIIPLQLQEQAKGRGVTAGGLAPLQTSRLRQLSIRQGLVASKGMFAAANLSAAQGDLSTALSMIDRAVENQFNPIKEEIAAKRANLELLLQDPNLALADKNRAIRLQTQLDAQEQQVEEQKADELKKGEIVATAASLGADALTIKALNKAKTSQEALEIAVQGGFVDTTALLQEKLLSEQIQTQITNRAIDLAEFELKKEGIIADSTVVANTINQELRGIPALDDKIKAFEDLTTHSGLNSAVGPTFAQRIAIIDIAGAKDAFIGSVQQLVSKETIDTLISLKARGGTLGALSDQERIMLQNAATKIGGWAIADDKGRVSGYDIDEKTFIKELRTMKDLAIRAKNVILSNSVSEEDFGEIEALFN